MHAKLFYSKKKRIFMKRLKFYTKLNIKNNFRDYIELFRVLQTIYEILYQFIIFE